jgi:hypothetical protein
MPPICMSAPSDVSFAEFNDYIYSSTTQANLVQIILNAPYKSQLILEYLRLKQITTGVGLTWFSESLGFAKSGKDKLIEFLYENMESRYHSVAEVVSLLKSSEYSYLVCENFETLRNSSEFQSVVCSMKNPSKLLADLFRVKVLNLFTNSISISGLESFPIVFSFLFVRLNSDSLGLFPDWKREKSLDEILLTLGNDVIKNIASVIKDYHRSGSFSTLKEKLEELLTPIEEVVSRELQYKRSLDAEYFDAWDTLNLFDRHIKDCLSNQIKHNSAKDRLMSPHCVILQASGTGKTKMVLEYGKRMEPVIYGPLRNGASSSDFSVVRVNFLNVRTKFEMAEWICFVIISALKVLKELIEAHQDKRIVLEEFMKYQGAFVRDKEFASFLGLPMEKGSKNYSVKMLYVALSDPVIAAEYPVIFLAIDDAGTLFNQNMWTGGIPFDIFKSGLASVTEDLKSEDRVSRRKEGLGLAKRSEIFMLLIDTTTELLYSTAKNPLRHPPFTLINNNSAYFISRKFNDPNWMISESEYFWYPNFYRLGRPLWGMNLVFSGSQDDRFCLVRNLARRKLLGPPLLDLNGQFFCFQSEAYLAVFNSRVPLPLPGGGSLVQKMAASHMRLILSLTDQSILGAYMNDPVLAQAAREISISEEKYSPKILLERLKEAIESGVVFTSHITQSMVAYIYILARDRIFHYRNLFKVKEFLEGFHPELAKQLRKDSDKRSPMIESLLNGDLTFSHFLNIQNSPSSFQLEDAFYRGFGLIGNGNRVYIPMRIQWGTAEETGNPAAAANYESNEAPEITNMKVKFACTFRISSIIKKDCSNYVYSAICITTDSGDFPKSSIIPILVIHHVLRPELEPEPIQTMPDCPYRYGFIIEGLDFVEEELPGVAGLIEEILVTHPNPYSHIEGNDMKLMMSRLTSHGRICLILCLKPQITVNEQVKIYLSLETISEL